MIDVSDGLSLDLHRLADASEVGFELGDVPVADGATLDEALGGGEDYELVITVAEADEDRLAAEFEAAGLRVPVRIGVVVADPSHADHWGRTSGPHGLAAPGRLARPSTAGEPRS